MRIQV